MGLVALCRGPPVWIYRLCEWMRWVFRWEGLGYWSVHTRLAVREGGLIPLGPLSSWEGVLCPREGTQR